MDGREGDDEYVRGDTGSRDSSEIPSLAFECTTALNDVPIGRVMPDARSLAEIRQRPCDDVSLGWMKVATRRVDTQRPAGIPKDLPGRESQRVPKKVSDAGRRDRSGGDQRVAKQLIVRDARQVIAAGGRPGRTGPGVQIENGRAVKRSEGTRLRRPVEIT